MRTDATIRASHAPGRSFATFPGRFTIQGFLHRYFVKCAFVRPFAGVFPLLRRLWQFAGICVVNEGRKTATWNVQVAISVSRFPTHAGSVLVAQLGRQVYERIIRTHRQCAVLWKQQALLAWKPQPFLLSRTAACLPGATSRARMSSFYQLCHGFAGECFLCASGHVSLSMWLCSHGGLKLFSADQEVTDHDEKEDVLPYLAVCTSRL